MLRLTLITLSALSAFAANSILCRMALAAGHMDAFSFSTHPPRNSQFRC